MGRTAALVPEFAVKELPLPWAEHSDDDDDDDDDDDGSQSQDEKLKTK